MFRFYHKSFLYKFSLLDQEIFNDPKTQVITDIKEQLHYNAWREVADIYTRWIQPMILTMKTFRYGPEFFLNENCIINK